MKLALFTMAFPEDIGVLIPIGVAVLVALLSVIIALLTRRRTVKASVDNDLNRDIAADMAQIPSVEAAPVETDDTTEVFRGVEKESGLAIVARYDRSFTARLIQASDEAKGYYGALKRAIHSYTKVTSRVSWEYDSVNAGRTKLLKFVVRGKTLAVYFALEDISLDEKYAVERVESKKYAGVSVRYKITSDRRLRYALELVQLLAQKYSLTAGESDTAEYAFPFESTEALIERDLIRELISKENYEEFMRRRSMREINRKHRDFVSAEEVDGILSDDVAVAAIEDLRKGSSAYVGKKSIINIDTLSKNYSAGDTVTLDSLKKKGLVGKTVGYVKVLARGMLDKPLTVEMQSYSIEAVKMILLTGGRVERV